MIELPPNTPWEDRVAAEAMNFVQAVGQNVAYGLETAVKHQPDPNAPEQRAVTLDYFLDAMVGLTVQTFTSYADPQASTEMEDKVVAQIRKKFAYVRKRIAEKPKVVSAEPAATV